MLLTFIIKFIINSDKLSLIQESSISICCKNITSAFVRATDLLNIMKVEKKKRGDFTYETAPQANKDSAEESLTNANLFVSHIRMFIQKQSS